MELVLNYDRIRELTISIRSYREGFITNLFVGESRCNLLIKKRLIYKIVFGKCAFVLYKDRDFYHVYYLATAENSLREGLQQLARQYPEETFVSDIIGTEANTQQLSELFVQAGFNAYSRLVRMSRTKGLDEPQVLNSDIEFAGVAQTESIRDVLETYFDKYSEQIPLWEEIVQLINDKKVLILRENELVTGLVVFEITGLTSYLRYWFTHPAFRDRKIGSAMLRRFFYECRQTKRQYFWVIASNENAIVRYRHYGFEPEQLFDIIMKK